METRIQVDSGPYSSRQMSFRPLWGTALLYSPIYALTFVLASLLWQRPLALASAYALLSSLLLWRWHSRSEVVFFTLAALLGPIAEFVAVSFGAWEYARPWINIPIWLPLAYGISGLFLKKTADALLNAEVSTAPNNSMEPTRPARG